MAFDYSTIDIEEILHRSYLQMDELQRPGVGKARKRGAVIFDVWMGVGKTFMGLTSALCYKPQTVLIICSKNAINTWRSQIEEWYPEFASDELFCIINDSKHLRELRYSKTKDSNGPLFYATANGSFIRDIDFLLDNQICFDVILIDEPQKMGIRNEKSKAWKCLKALVYNKYHPKKLLVFLTGSLTSKGVQQLWPYLHLINRQMFPSKWKFLNTHCRIMKGPFGTHIGGVKNKELLAQVTSPYIYRVSEKQAEQSLPPLRRIRLTTSLNKVQQKHYNTLANDMYMLLESGELISTASVLGATIKMRQFLNCPAVFDPSLGLGPGIDTIIDKIEEGSELPHYTHNAIFTPFIPSIPLFRTHLARAFKLSEEDIIVFQGGLDPDELDKREKQFRNNRETVALCSVKYSQSFNLETALNPYFVHFEWDQDENKQAEGRTRRQNSDKTRTIMSHYIHFPGLITEDMFDVLNNKSVINTRSYQGFDILRERLRRLKDG